MLVLSLRWRTRSRTWGLNDLDIREGLFAGVAMLRPRMGAELEEEQPFVLGNDRFVAENGAIYRDLAEAVALRRGEI